MIDISSVHQTPICINLQIFFSKSHIQISWVDLLSTKIGYRKEMYDCTCIRIYNL